MHDTKQGSDVGSHACADDDLGYHINPCTCGHDRDAHLDEDSLALLPLGVWMSCGADDCDCDCFTEALFDRWREPADESPPVGVEIEVNDGLAIFRGTPIYALTGPGFVWRWIR